MNIGLFVVATEYSMPVSDLAVAAEQRGFESIWLPEHTHIPLDSTFPGARGIPTEYGHLLDPFIGLSIAAAVTKNLRLGTGICLIVERDTIMTAKQVATLDLVSGGRFELGLGAGWNRKEMENHGTDYKTRFARMMDQIRAMKTIWTEEEPEYHGDFVNFDPMRCWPKPVQSPHPPILLGGESDHTLRRIVDDCDGWLPRMIEPELLLGQMRKLRQLAEDAARDIPVSIFGIQAKRETLQPFADEGVFRFILAVPAEDSDKTLTRLDRYAELV